MKAMRTTILLLIGAGLVFGAWAVDIVKQVGDTETITWSIKQPGSAPVKKVQITVTWDVSKLRYESWVKPAGAAPGGLSVTKNPDGSITLALDQGVDGVITGPIADLTFTCIAETTTPAGFTISGTRSWNAAGREFACLGISDPSLTINPRPGVMALTQK